MSMTAGSVSISDAGVETKSGMAQAIYDARWAQYVIAEAAALGASVYTTLPTLAQTVSAKRAIASDSNALAAAIVTYITANAKAQISTSLGALQRAGGVDTTAPTATREIPIV